MKQQWFKVGMYSLACIPGALILLDLGRRATQNQPLSLAVVQAQLPRDVRDPSSVVVGLDAEALKGYLRRAPNRVGDRVPAMKATDFRREELVIPARDRKPVVWIVSCGCIECGGVLHELVRLHNSYSDQFHAAAIVATRSHYVWGHHGGTFGSRPIQVAQDETGSLAYRLRPPGPDPDRLPVVWCCDGKGILRYVGRPLANRMWTAEITRLLNLKKPPVKVRAL